MDYDIFGLIEQYESGEIKGWQPDYELIKAYQGTLEDRTFGEAAPGLTDSGEGKIALLYENYAKIADPAKKSHLQTIGDCKIAGTLVTMADGTQKEIENVEVGDWVLSHKNIPRRVGSTIRKSYTGNLITIVAAKHNQPVTMTPDHQIITFPNLPYGYHSSGKNEDMEWTAASNLIKNIRVLIPYASTEAAQVEILDLAKYTSGAKLIGSNKVGLTYSKHVCNRFIPVDEKLCWLIGAFLAEGTAASSVRFALNCQEQLFAEEIKDAIQSIFGIEAKIVNPPSQKTSKFVVVYSALLANFFKALCPGTSYTKTVPTEIFRANKAARLQCLKGWIEGDGTYSSSKTLSGTSASKNLRTSMYRLALSCGLSPSLYVRKKIRDRESVLSGEVLLNTEDSRQLYPEIPANIKCRTIHKTKYGVATPIKSISVEYVENTTVYCIGVEKDHSFIANGYATHNCVSHGWGLGIDILACTEIVAGEREKWVAPVCTEIAYACSRVEIGGGRLGNSDGSMGSWMSAAVSKYGTLHRLKYLDKYDFTKYDGQVAKQLGRRGQGVPDELEPILREHPVRKVALVTSYKEARDAIVNGYPVPVCSNQGFTSTRDSDGFCRPKGRWGHCCPARTQIAMADGALKNIEDVRVGDYILSHKNKARRVNYLTRRLYTGRMVTIKAKYHSHSIEATDKHKFVTYPGIPYGSRRMQVDKTPIWNEIGNINERDRVLIPRAGPSDDIANNEVIDLYTYLDYKRIRLVGRDKISLTKKKLLNRYVEVDEDFCRLVGLYLAEGGVSGNQVTWSFNSNEHDYIKFVQEQLLKIFSATSSIYDTKQNCIRVICSSSILAKFFTKLIPGNCSTKDVPLCVFRASAANRKSCLNGWLDGDGHYGENECFEGDTISETLGQSMYRLALSCGFRSTYSKRPGRQADGVQRKDCYRVRFSGSSALAVRPVKTTHKFIGKQRDLVDGGLALPVESKTERQVENLQVYCLGVDVDESFIANGYAVHNCMLFCGVDDSYKRRGLLCWNSWGENWCGGTIRHGAPAGAFWVDADVADEMLDQDDSYAISGYEGFKSQEIDYNVF